MTTAVATARSAVRTLAADDGTDHCRRVRVFNAAARACSVAGVSERQVRGWLTTAAGSFPPHQAWMLV